MSLPVFAHFYGIKPWELQNLSPMEIEVLIDALPD